MVKILLGKVEILLFQFVSIIITEAINDDYFRYLSDIHCVSATMVTSGTASNGLMSINDIGSFITSHTTILMSDCSCTSMTETVIKTVTVMPSSAMTEQVSSDTQTG